MAASDIRHSPVLVVPPPHPGPLSSAGRYARPDLPWPCSSAEAAPGWIREARNKQRGDVAADEERGLQHPELLVPEPAAHGRGERSWNGWLHGLGPWGLKLKSHVCHCQ